MDIIFSSCADECRTCHGMSSIKAIFWEKKLQRSRDRFYKKIFHCWIWWLFFRNCIEKFFIHRVIYTSFEIYLRLIPSVNPKKKKNLRLKGWPWKAAFDVALALILFVLTFYYRLYTEKKNVLKYIIYITLKLLFYFRIINEVFVSEF